MKQIKLKLRVLLLLPLMFVVITACDDNSSGSSDELSDLRLSFSGLDALQNGFHYEGWALIGNEALTTGKFNINSSGGTDRPG